MEKISSPEKYSRENFLKKEKEYILEEFSSTHGPLFGLGMAKMIGDTELVEQGEKFKESFLVSSGFNQKFGFTSRYVTGPNPDEDAKQFAKQNNERIYNYRGEVVFDGSDIKKDLKGNYKNNIFEDFSDQELEDKLKNAISIDVENYELAVQIRNELDKRKNGN